MSIFRRKKPTAAEKQALHRALRISLWGIALTLSLGVFGPDYAWILGVLVGLALIGYGFRSLRRAAGVRSWLRVPARVLDTSLGEVVEPSRVAMYTHYYPVVEFEYTTPRGRFTARGYGVAEADPRSLDPKEALALLEPYPAGTQIEVYVRPDDHAAAVVQPDISRGRRSQYLAAIVAGLLVWAVVVWAALPA